ncbi:hypothetical protein [Sporosarcina sp. FSL W7-1283]
MREQNKDLLKTSKGDIFTLLLSIQNGKNIILKLPKGLNKL